MVINKDEEILVSYVRNYKSISDGKKHNIFETRRVTINEIYIDQDHRMNSYYVLNDAQLVEALKSTLQRHHGGDTVTIINFWLFQNN